MPQEWTPKSEIAKAVYAAGFNYDPEQDIIFSRMNAWQRDFGYAYVFDLAAPMSISAVIDCEPFFFHYNKKDWMIELWKGQYGLETGCEIGVYVHKRPYLDLLLGWRPHDQKNGKFFDCADNKERLNFSFTLNRKGSPLFKRGPEQHWWLTGFKWGVLSEPEDLAMDLSIGFPDSKMCNAFVGAVQEAGYSSIKIESNTVSFTFRKTTSHQPRSESEYKAIVKSVRENNGRIVKEYKKLNLKDNDPNHIDDNMAGNFISYFKYYNPDNYKEQFKKAFKISGRSMKEFDKSIDDFFKKGYKSAKKAISDFFKKIFG